MSSRMITMPLALGALALTATFATDARADILEACGGVYFEALAEGSCEVVPTQECDTVCEPTASVLVCAADLEVACESQCLATASLECQTACTETCVPDCETTLVDPSPPNCMGLCMSDCQQDCTAACEGVEDHGECRSGCAQTCATDCHAQCDPQEETTCEPVCTAACEGSCEARANIDCQLSCQGQSFATCETEVAEECRTDCETTGAAIFCDGQYLAAAGDLQGCADELRDQFGFILDIDIDIDGDVEGECVDGMCEVDAEAEGEGDATLGCFSTVDRNGTRGLGWASLLLLLGVGGVVRRRYAR